MERKLRRCCVCGNEYKYCSKCGEDANKPLWYFSFCSENCKKIYDVTSKFEGNNISAVKAKNILNNLNLSRIDFFGKSYKRAIENIDKIVMDSEQSKFDSIVESTIADSETDNEDPKKIKYLSNRKLIKKADNEVE